MRLDLFLVKKKLAVSRTQAQDLIKAGHVTLHIDQKVIVLQKTSFDVSPKQESGISVKENNLQKYVSRGGNKIEAAVSKLEIVIKGYTVLDVGQSTGGFTDFLLQNNAEKIVGFDVGHSQLHEKLRNVSQVVFFEGLHVKNLLEDVHFLKHVPEVGFDLIVMDLSFISITKVMVYLKPFLKKNGEYLFLVKPQFELTAQALDGNGIVKESKFFDQVRANVEQEARNHFGRVISYIPSELSGKDGNQEFFIYGRKTN